MTKRERVLEGLQHCINLHGRRGCSECPYNSVYGDDRDCIEELMTEACKVLEDTTNPKGAGCPSCKYDMETDTEYCDTHTRCRVCGCCSGYERKEEDADE